MKQLELELKERLLIVEKIVIANGEEIDISESMIFGIEKMVKAKFICKGSELTEEVAKVLVHSMNFGTDNSPDIGYYHGVKDNYWAKSALESFKSTIEAQGYYWGENPVIFDDNEIDFNKRYEIRINWEKAEPRTFNPEKTLIFKIV